MIVLNFFLSFYWISSRFCISLSVHDKFPFSLSCKSNRVIIGSNPQLFSVHIYTKQIPFPIGSTWNFVILTQDTLGSYWSTFLQPNASALIYLNCSSYSMFLLNRHMDSQNEVLMEAYRSMFHELRKLQVFTPVHCFGLPNLPFGFLGFAVLHRLIVEKLFWGFICLSRLYLHLLGVDNGRRCYSFCLSD